MARSPEPMEGLVAEVAVADPVPMRGWVALRLVDAAILMLRVTAILVLLSPLLGLAILLG
ncbi:hypothetical protein [Paracraurococcus lichenis]|uniref:Uncharacterized protein n=1 Tax=Paracraurococcus lichenis TaxID=3064888 RepID=A0ABT9DU02_9PROT|nr:hypothetical protein [Paracraurococcus sp. LOR1-02]MDO9707382.1 hypothetical protein [Paracraurococcus sp. LOR1-02]